MHDKIKDVDIVGVASGLLTRIFEYPLDTVHELERRFGFTQNSFSWLPVLPAVDDRQIRGTCFSTVEESLLIAAHMSKRTYEKVLFAVCGADAEGAEFSRLMRDGGIRYETPPSPGRRTFTTHIYVSPDDKEPTIISLTGGASDQLIAADIKQDVVARSQFLMADAYNVSVPALHEVIVYASKLAREHGTKVVYGLGRHEVVRDNRDAIETYVDTCRPEIINGNQFEFRELLFGNWNKQITDDDLSRCVQTYIRSKEVEVAIITFADRGSHVVTRRERIAVPACYVPEERIKDKACGGTAYMGGFLEALCRGKGYKDAGMWGSYAATQTLQQYGLAPDWVVPPKRSSVAGCDYV